MLQAVALSGGVKTQKRKNLVVSIKSKGTVSGNLKLSRVLQRLLFSNGLFHTQSFDGADLLYLLFLIGLRERSRRYSPALCSISVLKTTRNLLENYRRKAARK